MTVLVGIRCKDGVIIGADSSATFGDGQIRTIEQSAKKIELIQGSSIIVASTGQGGLGQRFCYQVKAAFDAKAFLDMNGVPFATKMCQIALADFASTNTQRGQYGCLAAFKAKDGVHLVEFALSDMQPELKEDIWYAAMGSGQLIADPFLGLMREVFWQDGMPTVKEGLLAAVWTIQHAINLNPGGINGPVRIAILSLDGTTRMLSEADIGEHLENMKGAMNCLKEYIHPNGALQAAHDIPIPPVQ